MNKKFTRNDDDDEMFFSPMKGPLGFTVNTRQMHNFSVHINEEIKSPDYYSKIFDMLIDAGTWTVCGTQKLLSFTRSEWLRKIAQELREGKISA